MGRAADSLERTRRPLEPKPRPARREDSEFSRRGFGETGCGAQLFLRNDVPWNSATRDLPFRADRNGLEHAAVAKATSINLTSNIRGWVQERTGRTMRATYGVSPQTRIENKQRHLLCS